ncbi:putative phospholipid-binding lipoprotein MlaA precursor [Paracoccus haematequi]|uniref:Putative phospholipid-binding lipoprotein MlaA n=1 Tax=Paracoccus haematequi TaxID=2491866 RepID=A0A3S4CWC9_9RHOB|nr:putative phospholipid-binding lipoprotein MlaA precursor [Paracoccus haematequi]
MLRPLSLVVPLALGVILAGCTSEPVMQDGIRVNDPFESGNRRIHAFNKGFDQRVVAPVARRVSAGGNEAGEPGAMDLVINAGANLSLPGKVVNSLLQGRPEPAIRNFFRFAVNTTLGMGGLLDPAGTDFGLPEVDTDFGETLAVWGVPEGAYLELPVLGPSTQRDAAGKVVDLLIDPVYHLLHRDAAWAAFGLRAASKAGDRARFGDTVDSVLQDSADSYAQLRLIYLMHRRHELNQGGTEIDPYADAAADDVIDPYDP